MQYSFIQQAFSEHLLYISFWSRGQGRAESLPSREVLRADFRSWLRDVDEDGGLGGRRRAYAAARLSRRPSQP